MPSAQQNVGQGNSEGRWSTSLLFLVWLLLFLPFLPLFELLKLSELSSPRSNITAGFHSTTKQIEYLSIAHSGADRTVSSTTMPRTFERVIKGPAGERFNVIGTAGQLYSIAHTLQTTGMVPASYECPERYKQQEQEQENCQAYPDITNIGYLSTANIKDPISESYFDALHDSNLHQEVGIREIGSRETEGHAETKSNEADDDDNDTACVVPGARPEIFRFTSYEMFELAITLFVDRAEPNHASDIKVYELLVLLSKDPLNCELKQNSDGTSFSVTRPARGGHQKSTVHLHKVHGRNGCFERHMVLDLRKRFYRKFGWDKGSFVLST